MFRRDFRRALQNATRPLLVCMDLLLDRNDYVNLDDLSARCGRSASHVMGNFSNSFGRHRTQDEVRSLYLDTCMHGNRVVAYRLKTELSDIVDDVLQARGIRQIVGTEGSNSS